jgi:hypothetical protein
MSSNQASSSSPPDKISVVSDHSKNYGATLMIFEVTFWIAFIAVSRMIAKIYDRRRDVLYGPYRDTLS